MTDAPEKIFVYPSPNDHVSPAKEDWSTGVWDDEAGSGSRPYVRADRIEALEAENARLRAQLEQEQGESQ